MLPILLTTAIFAYFIYAAHVLDLHRPALETLCKPIGDWFGEAGNPVRAGVWAGAILLSLASWLSPSSTLFNQMLPDFISISIAVIVIDELVGYRNKLERKQEITAQIESTVRDVAIEAIRLAKKYKFLDEALQIVDLEEHDIQGANFEGVNLQGKELYKVNLQNANLCNADLQDAKLMNAKLQGANLQNAKLQRANLTEAILWQAILLGAELQEAFLLQAKLEHTDLRKAKLQAAILTDARLNWAVLTAANLEGAWLTGTNLKDTILDTVNLHGAKYNRFTLFPDGFDPDAAGAIFIDTD